MIDFTEVKKHYSGEAVLDGSSFRINPGEHVGVVGPNGAGKSTIFKLITGEAEPDAGDVVIPSDARLGHLRQQLFGSEEDGSLLEYACRALPELPHLHEQIVEVEHQLPQAGGSEREALLGRLGRLQHRFEDLGGYDLESRAEAALSGLGFHEDDFSRPFSSFSGGWQMRAELVRTLIARPDILLLDEPSNYLDLPAVEWLQRFLKEFAGTMLLISHDRYLLESLTDQTLEISGGQTVKYAGGFSYYIREREQRREQQAAAYRNYIERKEQLESFIRRFRAKATKAAQVQSRIKMLEKMEEIKQPPSPPDLSYLRIADPPRAGAQILTFENAGFTYDGNRWIFRGEDLTIHRGDKVALVGYNGMGKTTLLRTFAGLMHLTEGKRTLGYHVVIGYQSQEFADTMPPDQSVLRIVKEANPAVSDREVRTLCGSFGFSGDAADKPCRVLSGGEKIRLAFARIFARPPNFLLLDEPTTHLDVYGRQALEKAIREYKGTVCLVSHDVTFVRNTADRILAIDEDGITGYSGGYDYFLEKQAEAAGNQPDASAPRAKTEKAATPSPPSPSARDTTARGKEGRVARARRRKAQQGLRDMEKKMEAFNAERERIHGLFAEANPEYDYAALNRELAEINRRITDLESRWLEKAEALEANAD